METFRLFGRDMALRVDDSPAADVLAGELAVYPRVDAEPRHPIALTHAAAPADGMPNPKSHIELPDGFVARYPNASVRYQVDRPGSEAVTIHLPPALTGLRQARQRWRSIQYATPDESAGQLVHELAAIPLLYWGEGGIPVHAAAVDLPGVGMTLIGGTGGTGKTSLALELCARHDAEFAADDMSVVDDEGLVHPNLAQPKVYGYNLADSPALRKRVLLVAGPIDRAQWQWRIRRVGPAGVRRRMAPSRLFDRTVIDPRPLVRYAILVRDEGEAVRIEPLDAARATVMSLDVLQAEYADHHRHLRWHAFNCRAVGREPSIDLEHRFDSWRASLERVLSRVDCLLVRIPAGLGALPMRERVARMLSGA